MGRPVTLVILVGVAAVLALSGPFGTADHLPLPALFAYWLSVSALCFSVGFVVDSTLHNKFSGALGSATCTAMSVLAIGTLVSGCILVINALVFGYRPDGGELLVFLATTFAISGIVTVVIQVVLDQLAQRAPAGAAPPPILERLPLDKRGALVALSVEDHYVRVRTTVAEEMLLLRLADAMRETGATPGAQVHRSHWVAFDQVQAARRAGDRAILTMRDGTEVPVSRANIAKIREAGLLPR